MKYYFLHNDSSSNVILQHLGDLEIQPNQVAKIKKTVFLKNYSSVLSEMKRKGVKKITNSLFKQLEKNKKNTASKQKSKTTTKISSNKDNEDTKDEVKTNNNTNSIKTEENKKQNTTKNGDKK